MWVESGENRDACEASVVLTKSQSTKMQGTKELVSVQEMVRRGWPKNKILGAIRAGNGVKDEHAPNDPTLVSYWCRVSTQQVDTSEVRQDSHVRIQAQVDANTISAVTSAPTLDNGLAAAGAITNEQLEQLAASIGGTLVLDYHKSLLVCICVCDVSVFCLCC